MLRYFSFLLAIFLANTATAQIHELGVWLGGSNYIGDIGATKYIAPKNLAYGLVYKWNKSPRHSWRFSYIQSEIEGDDAKSESAAKKQRNLSFTNTIQEFSAGLEFNFQDFNLHEQQPKFTPYIYTGLTVFIYSENFFLGKTLKVGYDNGQAAIPMIVGLKSNITENLILAGEVGARYTFTDNLDGSNPANKNLKSLAFGNIDTNDWYVFTGVTLTYTFGERPCYCR